MELGVIDTFFLNILGLDTSEVEPFSLMPHSLFGMGAREAGAPEPRPLTAASSRSGSV